MATVARFNLTPVKSTALQHPSAIELGAGGVDEDRRFLFLDADGRRLSGTSKTLLFRIRATYDRGREWLSLELPDGTRTEGDASPDGSPVRVALFDREVDARPVKGAFDAIVSGSLGSNVTLVRVEAPEHAGGAHRVSLMSLASVDELARRSGVADRPDPRRFRMLIEVDGCDPHEEDTRAGRRVRVGDAVVRVAEPMPRCVVTALDPETGEPDFPTLDVLSSYRRTDEGLLFGMVADVDVPGRVRVGDPVDVLADG